MIPRQPQFWKVPIPVGRFLQDKKSNILKPLLVGKRLFVRAGKPYFLMINVTAAQQYRKLRSKIFVLYLAFVLLGGR